MTKVEKALLWTGYAIVLLFQWLWGLVMPRDKKMTKEQKRAYLMGKDAGKKEQKKTSSRKAKKKK